MIGLLRMRHCKHHCLFWCFEADFLYFLPCQILETSPMKSPINRRNTVGGRNPAPVEVGSLSRYLHGFIHLSWLAGFLP